MSVHVRVCVINKQKQADTNNYIHTDKPQCTTIKRYIVIKKIYNNTHKHIVLHTFH